MHETLSLPYLAEVSDDALCDRLAVIGENLSLREYNLKDQTVYRARIGDFRTVSSLTYPPSHLISTYGRLNIKNDSKFYCSTQLAGAIEELRVNVGDTVSVLVTEFKAIHPVAIGMELTSLVGSHPDDVVHAIRGRLAHYSHFKDPSELVKLDMANAFFHGLITAPSDPLLHRLTGLFSKRLFSLKEFDGVMFPASVSKRVGVGIGFGAANFALSPDFVDLNAKHVQIFVFQLTEQKDYKKKLKVLHKHNIDG